MNEALLIARVFFGLGMAAHGAQKLFGWFGGYGIAGTGGFMESLGFRPGKLFALEAGLGEITGGLLVALGLLGPVGPALMVSVMLVAAVSVHLHNGFFVTKNGVEMPLLYAMAALVLAFSGPGAYALDEVMGLADVWSGNTALIAIGIAVAGAALNLLSRRVPAAAAKA